MVDCFRFALIFSIAGLGSSKAMLYLFMLQCF
jgi:hypothetical protein